MVLAFYALLIAGSATVLSMLLLRLSGRLAQFVDSYVLGVVADAVPAFIAIAFLMVVEAPPMVLSAAFMLFLAGIFQAHRPLSFAIKTTLLVTTVVLGVTAIAQGPGAWPAQAPALLCVLAACAAWLLVSASAWTIQPTANMFAIMLVLSLLPIAAAPLLFKGAHASLATDTLVIAAALFGGSRGWKPEQPAYLLLRAPLVFILASMQWEAVRYGAWPCAAASLGVWLAAVGYAKSTGYGDSGVYVLRR